MIRSLIWLFIAIPAFTSACRTSPRVTGQELSDKEWKLADFKQRAATAVQSGQKVAWSGLVEPGLTNEKARTMDTVSLAKACLSSGILTRQLGLYNDPDYAIVAVSTYYPGFEELFARKDLWKGVLAIMDQFTTQLRGEDATLTTHTMVNAVMGLESFPDLYKTTVMKRQLRGREDEFIQAHLRALRELRVYLDKFDPRHPIPPAPFSPEACAWALVSSALNLIIETSPEKGERMRDGIYAALWPREHTKEDVIKFLDLAIKDIDCLIKETHR